MGGGAVNLSLGTATFVVEQRWVAGTVLGLRAEALLRAAALAVAAVRKNLVIEYAEEFL